MSQWPEKFRNTLAECNGSRCIIIWRDGQCHLKAGHPGKCDPQGESHLGLPKFAASPACHDKFDPDDSGDWDMCFSCGTSWCPTCKELRSCVLMDKRVEKLEHMIQKIWQLCEENDGECYSEVPLGQLQDIIKGDPCLGP